MRVFICEYVTSGGHRDKPLSETLLPEGTLIRDALLADVEELADTEVLLTHDDRLPAPSAASVPIAAGDDPFAVWARLATSADVVWPVAPETDDLLLQVTRRFRATGAAVICAEPAAIALASSKLETARRLQAAGIAHIPTVPVAQLPAGWTGPLVTKPERGAGCTEVRAWPDRSALPVDGGPQTDQQGDRQGGQQRDQQADLDPCRQSRLVVQPFVEGQAASLTLLVRPDGTTLLTANHQHLSEMVGQYSLTGLTVGALADADGTLAALGERIVEALPGLSGIIGVDILITPQGPVVVEINPRVTTSYAGLHAALGVNPASLIPELARGERPAPLPHLPPPRPVDVMIR